MGAKSLAKQARISLVPTGETARLFDQMRKESNEARPRARNIVSLKVQFPDEWWRKRPSLTIYDLARNDNLAAHELATDQW